MAWRTCAPARPQWPARARAWPRPCAAAPPLQPAAAPLPQPRAPASHTQGRARTRQPRATPPVAVPLRKHRRAGWRGAAGRRRAPHLPLGLLLGFALALPLGLLLFLGELAGAATSRRRALARRARRRAAAGVAGGAGGGGRAGRLLLLLELLQQRQRGLLLRHAGGALDAPAHGANTPGRRASLSPQRRLDSSFRSQARPVTSQSASGLARGAAIPGRWADAKAEDPAHLRMSSMACCPSAMPRSMHECSSSLARILSSSSYHPRTCW